MASAEMVGLVNVAKLFNFFLRQINCDEIIYIYKIYLSSYSSDCSTLFLLAIRALETDLGRTIIDRSQYCWEFTAQL